MAKKKSSKQVKSGAAAPEIKAGAFSSFVASLEHRAEMLKKYSFALEILAVLVIIIAGFYIRMEDLGEWKKNEQKTFFNAQPLHTTFDAYFYLSLAKDLVDGTYYPIDEKRSVPDCPVRPSPPPLISVLAAAIAKTTSFSLSWIGAVLPALLGPLLAIPLYLTGRYLGGPVMGFVAALTALLYPFYIFRSNIGRFDTDCLNVTFTLSAAYLFLRFGIVTTRARYLYFIASLIVYGLFMWWWDQTPAVVTALTFLPFAVALAFFYRPKKKEAIIFFGFLAAAGLAFTLIKGPGTIFTMLKSLFLQYLYISKDAGGDFPNIGVTISEQSRPSLDTVLSFTTGNVLSFLFGVAGIFLLFWKKFRHSLFLISLIILSVLTFTYANRFLIFFVPLLALGTGFSLSALWSLRQRFLPLYIVCPAVLILLVVPLYNENKKSTQWPKELAPVVKGMDVALKQTPPDAVIWAWWDHGYALTYFGRRATINDGSVHSGERTFFTAIPLTTDNYRYAANFMHFYVKRGMPGIHEFCDAADKTHAEGFLLIKDILTSGPDVARAIIENIHFKPSPKIQTTEDRLKFFFPPDKRPVYLFLDNLLTKITYWWFWFGTWDIEKHDGEHPFYNPAGYVQIKDGKILGSNGLSMDTDTGELYLENKPFPIAHFSNRKRSNLEQKKYSRSSQYCFEMFEQGRFGALMDTQIAESVFNKLFIRHTYPKEYFQPLDLNTPVYQLWEVKGDSLEEPKS